MPWTSNYDSSYYLPDYMAIEDTYSPYGQAAENEAEAAAEKEWKSRGSGNTFSRTVSGYGGGGGGGGGYGSMGVVNLGKYENIPSAPSVAPLKLPDYKAPEYNEQERKKEVQKAAAPGLMNLRHQVQTAMMRKNENPNVTRMTLRDALAGYGQGLGQVMGGAEKAGTAAYGEKYNRAAVEAQTNWNKSVQEAQSTWAAQNTRQMAEYNALLQDYMKSTYSPSGAGGVGGMTPQKYYEMYQRPGTSYAPGGWG